MSGKYFSNTFYCRFHMIYGIETNYFLVAQKQKFDLTHEIFTKNEILMMSKIYEYSFLQILLPTQKK